LRVGLVDAGFDKPDAQARGAPGIGSFGMIALFKRLVRCSRLLGDPDGLLLERVRPYTMMSRSKLRNLKRLASQVVSDGVAGDFVECGTCKGGSSAVIASALRSDRHLWLYDSFEGLPEAGDVDGPAALAWTGGARAVEQDVIDVLTATGIRPERYTIRKGWFEDSFQQPLPKQVAFLHCDADWHDSVLLTLETFYPLMADGGIVVLDDFGWWEGCREAFYSFCWRHDERPLLERCGSDQAWWIKGKTHSRKLPDVRGTKRSAAREVRRGTATLPERDSAITVATRSS
jgi:O-methyltransferase